MLEKLAARKWLGSKALEKFWLELARAMKIVARYNVIEPLLA